jgi:hypothetical protein
MINHPFFVLANLNINSLDCSLFVLTQGEECELATASDHSSTQ